MSRKPEITIRKARKEDVGVAEIQLAYLECVLMPNGEVISNGGTIGTVGGSKIPLRVLWLRDDGKEANGGEIQKPSTRD